MTHDFPITIFHNPDCGTSRNVVAMVRAAGYEPFIVEYLKVGWTEQQLRDLARAAGLSLRDLVRDKGTPASATPASSRPSSAAAMVAHPVLVNRPIVTTPLGTKLARPSEAVFDLLERRPEIFTKEDGELVGRGDG
ncbi:MAG: arsenate reductase family protein [Caulobacteraceae bacterium]|nr:MAG: arsenate reductase family protein [Caulobacteraceae bacterium]